MTWLSGTYLVIGFFGFRYFTPQIRGDFTDLFEGGLEVSDPSTPAKVLAVRPCLGVVPTEASRGTAIF